MQEILQEIVGLQDSTARDRRLLAKYDQLERKLEERRERITEEMAYYDEYLERHLKFLRKENAIKASKFSRGIKSKLKRIKAIEEIEDERNKTLQDFTEDNYEVYDSYESNFGTYKLINFIGRSIKTYEIFLVDVKKPYNQIRKTRELVSKIVEDEANRLHGIKFNEGIDVRYKTEVRKDIGPVEVSFETVYKDLYSSYPAKKALPGGLPDNKVEEGSNIWKIKWMDNRSCHLS